MKALIFAACLLLGFSACKNGQKATDAEEAPHSQEGTPGLDLSRDIKVIAEEPEHFVTISPADGSEGKDYSTGTAYVDSVERAYRKGKFGWFVTGNLPDGCSTLHEASYTVDGETVQITLRSRKPSGAMCTQALVPFSYFIEVGDEAEFESITRWSAGEAGGTLR